MHRRPYRLLRKFSTSASVSSKSNVTLGIRREDPARIWERRTPLTPEAVNYLVSKKNVAVDVEHCDRRVFPDSEYIKAGATIKPKLDDAHIIIGIKETPLPELITSPISSPTSPNALRERTHLMFSHTIKGQTYNTPLLARFVGPSNSPPDPLSSRLIDYELLTSEKDGKRSVGFGWFAGVAGALESLSAMAHSHLTLGIASPFLYTPRPHTHPSLDSLRSALRDIGKRIAEEGTPKTLGPFVIGLTGTGKVSQGCLDILKELPIEHVRVKDLHGLVTNPDTDLRKIYLVHAKAEDYLVRTDVASGSYDRTHYYANPSSYKSVFADKVAPYLTLFLNGTGWSSAFPRLMSNPQLTTAMEKAESLGGLRFRNVGDISCDIEGGLQFLTRATTLSDPFYMVYPPKEGESGVTESSAVEDTTMAKKRVGVNMMSVDILPAALPMDASMHFSKVLLPYLEEVVGWYSGETTQQGEEKRALDRATVAKDGKLEENHKWLQGNVDGFYAENPHKASASTSTSGVFTPTMQPKPQSTLTTPSAPTPTPTKPTSHLPGAGMKKKRVLMLGSGMVAGPAVDEIAKRGDVELVIASNVESEAKRLQKGKENVSWRVIDMMDREAVERLVEESDVVISLLPVAFHVAAAELCIKHGKHLVTASYISPDMRNLNERATQANVLLLNEIGLDPGIDHCSALDIIARLHGEKKHISSFTSFCGGLPAPDVDPTIPLRYKFSWSPRGVLSAALNPARFRLHGKTVNISPDKLLKKAFKRIPVTKEFELEGLPNRDSVPYAGTYGIESAETVLRGTLRYPGFCSLMQSFRDIGFLNTEDKIQLNKWAEFVPFALGIKNPNQAETQRILKKRIDDPYQEALFSALQWLSLSGQSNPAMPPLPTQPMTPIDIFAYLLAHRLRYEPNERDMVVLHHEFIVPVPNQGEVSKHVWEEEVHTSQLIVYGNSEASAMARTVGIPVALAALLVLDGKVALRGVHGPMDQSVYRPVLSGLEEIGLGMKEEKRTVTVLRPQFETVKNAIATARL